jgi:hypothetical protein
MTRAVPVTIALLLALSGSPHPSDGLISGRVVDAQSHAPIVGASVRLARLRFAFSVTGKPLDIDVSFDDPPGSLQTMVTGADGAFEFRDVPEGRYSIWVIHSGHQSGR